MSYHAPKKSLGQNFLTSIPARIAMKDAGELTSSDVVLEVGPGKGFLTEELLKTGASVIALEKDCDLIPLLNEKFKNETATKQLVITEGDVLTFDPTSYIALNSSYKLIANIPYYITGAILSRFLSHEKQPSLMAVLVQKEVAERVCAKDGKESLLSLSVQAYGTPTLAYKVSKGSFFPIPKVDSAILKIANISRKNFKNQYHEQLFFKLIHAGFAHKRKFALSNIRHVFPTFPIETIAHELLIPSNARAEDIHLTTWLLFAERLCSYK